MLRYFPLLLLRLSLGLVFAHFGYEAIVRPELAAAFVSPAVSAFLPITVEQLVFLTGLFDIAIALAFFLGFWLPLMGLLGALHLTGVVVSLGTGFGWFTDITLRDAVIACASLVLAQSGPHPFALQPTINWRRFDRLAFYLILLGIIYAFLLTGWRLTA